MAHDQSSATEWFSATSLRLSDARSLASIEEVIGAAVRDRPEFEEALIAEARRAIAGNEREFVHRACAVLAVTGDDTDVPRLEAAARSKDSWVAGAAKMALFRIGGRTK